MKGLVSKKFAIVASHKLASIVIASAVVVSAGTGVAVVYAHNNAVKSNVHNNTVTAAKIKPKAKKANTAANAQSQPVVQQTAAQTAPAADPNQTKYDQAKAAAGSRLNELLTGLKKLGYDVATDTVDAKTYCSIITFEKDCGLKQDGIPGNQVFDALEAKLNPQSSSSSKSTNSSSSNSSSGTKHSSSGQASSSSQSTQRTTTQTTASHSATTSVQASTSAQQSSASQSEPSYMHDPAGYSGNGTGVITQAGENQSIQDGLKAGYFK